MTFSITSNNVVLNINIMLDCHFRWVLLYYLYLVELFFFLFCSYFYSLIFWQRHDSIHLDREKLTDVEDFGAAANERSKLGRVKPKQINVDS